MFNMIKTWVLSNIFIHGFKTLEKQDFVTVALCKCYTVPDIQRVWGAFTDSVISLLEDAISEVKVAKKWK